MWAKFFVEIASILHFAATIKDVLGSMKDKTDKLLTAGIYEIGCECDQMYVGETGRPINTRIVEH